MNKDFWDKMDRLEELTHNIPAEIWEYEVDNENLKNSYGRRFGVVEVNYGKYIAAANPVMILEMITEMRRLEKEADWLAEKLADSSCLMFDDEMEDLGFECSHECKQIGCTLECRKINWKESARKAVSEADNA